MNDPGFASRPLLASGEAPGRVNLLGEHTDYSGGYALPTAIPQTTRVEFCSSPDRRFHVYSANFDRTIAFSSTTELPRDFARYIFGCVEMLRKRGVDVPPVAMRIQSTVPIGAGLSSSAALEVAVLRGFRALLNIDMDDIQLAKLARRAEAEYAGVNCGVLDQMATSLCDSAHMLFIDTRTLDTEILPLPDGASVIVVDSNTPRALEATAYGLRRVECSEAATLLGVRELRDIDDPDSAAALPCPLNRRARHVISENNRVLEARSASPARFGALMNASHDSLRRDYDVSIPALDCLAECLRRQPGVFGARLTGAGFGGACVALVERDAATTAIAGALSDFTAAGYRGKALV
jgi:galactokinase